MDGTQEKVREHSHRTSLDRWSAHSSGGVLETGPGTLWLSSKMLGGDLPGREASPAAGLGG